MDCPQNWSIVVLLLAFFSPLAGMYFLRLYLAACKQIGKDFELIIVLRIFILFQIFTLSICTHLDALQKLSPMGFV